MQDYLDRVKNLATLGAPAEAHAIALLWAWLHDGQTQEEDFGIFLDLASRASNSEPAHAPPEIKTMLELDARLPCYLRLLNRSDSIEKSCPEASIPMVERTIEAITPWMLYKTSFKDAIKIADCPGQWWKASPQITIIDSPALPCNGSLWRARLTKETNLGLPFVTDMVSRETIDITAEGSCDDKEGGHRCYSYVFVSALKSPNHLQVIEDTGRIELSGGPDGIQLRLQKRVGVLRPVIDPFAPVLTAALTAELWLWGNGFLVAADPAHEPVECPKLPHSPKWIKVHAQAAGKPPKTKVTVLGGGPAGLACAWLLSNVSSTWRPPAGGLDLEVKVIEKGCQPGGKCASGRRIKVEQYRIEEHGLHVVMGFYANLQRMLYWIEASKGTIQPPNTLQNIWRTRVPYRSDGDPGQAWDIDMGSWKRSIPGSLAHWCSNNGAITPYSLEQLEKALHFDRPRTPAIRGLAGISNRLLSVPRPATLPLNTWQFLIWMIRWLLLRLFQIEWSFADFGHAKGDSGRSTDVAPLARLLRQLARCALPADDEEPKIREVSELIELVTTIAIGLDEEGLFPRWALDDPNHLLGDDYPCWVRTLQEQDARSISSWLKDYGVVAGFPERSRLLAAFTAGLFTTPDEIAAGTFINGMARFLVNYKDAPYKRLAGGTGEAVIGPIYRALVNAHVPFLLDTEITRFDCVGKHDPDVVSVQASTHGTPADGNFDVWPNDEGNRQPGWRKPLEVTPITRPDIEYADAFVLAVPPFGKVIPGLPAKLEQDLAGIQSRATIGVQSWTFGQPRYKGAIVAAYASPLRCVAAMDHLIENGAGNNDYCVAPVYASGDVEDDVAKRWKDDGDKAGGELAKWLAASTWKFQEGARAHPAYLSVNLEFSERYVCANVKTQKVRRYTYDTGVRNLWLAGDWTRTALSCGSLEAAVTSGLEAARDILEHLGCEVDFPITGPSFTKEERR